MYISKYPRMINPNYYDRADLEYTSPVIITHIVESSKKRKREDELPIISDDGFSTHTSTPVLFKKNKAIKKKNRTGHKKFQKRHVLRKKISHQSSETAKYSSIKTQGKKPRGRKKKNITKDEARDNVDNTENQSSASTLKSLFDE